MAKAKLKKKEVREVVLRLTEPEAQVLVDLLARVGGNHLETRRGLTDNIYVALNDVGFCYDRSSACLIADPPDPEITGHILFKR